MSMDADRGVAVGNGEWNRTAERLRLLHGWAGLLLRSQDDRELRELQQRKQQIEAALRGMDSNMKQMKYVESRRTTGNV